MSRFFNEKKDATPKASVAFIMGDISFDDTADTFSLHQLPEWSSRRYFLPPASRSECEHELLYRDLRVALANAAHYHGAKFCKVFSVSMVRSFGVVQYIKVSRKD